MSKLRIGIILSLLTLPLFSQTFNNVPTGLATFDTSEKLPGAATNICSSGTVAVTRTSGSILSIGTGASSSAPQSIRFGFKTRQLTGAATLTISSGSASGKVVIYGTLDASDNLVLKALDSSNNTFSTSGIDLVKSSSTEGVSIASKGVKLFEWPITSGSYPVSGSLTYQASKDCWIERLVIANTSGSAVTISVTDGLGSPVSLLNGTSLAANSTFVLVDYGTIFFDNGMKITPSAANAVEIKARGGRRY